MSRLARRGILVAAPLVFLLSTATAWAADAAKPPADVDPQALSALDRMGKTLRSLDHFQLTSDTSTDVVLDNAQKIRLEGQVLYQVQRPNRIFVDMVSDRHHRQIFYDGSKFTLYSPRLKYYATVDNVSGTLGELVARAEADYDIEFPLADLFLWGTDRAPRDALKSAMFVGGGKLDGEFVDQYAFRQDGVDWQLWISSETSLPKQLVITSLDDPTQPQYTAHLHWDTRKLVDAKAFTFVPPKGASRIKLVAVDATASTSGDRK